MIYTYLHTLPLHDARPIYHLGPHLRAIEPGGGRGDKTRHLDDREAAQQLVHAVSLSRLGRKIAQHVLGDLQLEDLRRPFIDAIDARIAEEPLGVIFGEITRPALADRKGIEWGKGVKVSVNT